MPARPTPPIPTEAVAQTADQDTTAGSNPWQGMTEEPAQEADWTVVGRGGKQKAARNAARDLVALPPGEWHTLPHYGVKNLMELSKGAATVLRHWDLHDSIGAVPWAMFDQNY